MPILGPSLWTHPGKEATSYPQYIELSIEANSMLNTTASPTQLVNLTRAPRMLHNLSYILTYSGIWTVHPAFYTHLQNKTTVPVFSGNSLFRFAWFGVPYNVLCRHWSPLSNPPWIRKLIYSPVYYTSQSSSLGSLMGAIVELILQWSLYRKSSKSYLTTHTPQSFRSGFVPK